LSHTHEINADAAEDVAGRDWNREAGLRGTVDGGAVVEPLIGQRRRASADSEDSEQGVTPQGHGLALRLLKNLRQPFRRYFQVPTQQKIPALPPKAVNDDVVNLVANDIEGNLAGEKSGGVLIASHLGQV
jgi:hypothetical protein